jgi:hypothetical protein
MHPEAWTPPDYLTKSLDDPITRIPGPLDAHATNGRLDERIDSTALSARRQARRAPAG